jgi:HEAT repeat protein/DNA-binding NarL/FixJ family response regulator/tRNA A-37 threonylcarbamoyl transferase component Bud32
LLDKLGDFKLLDLLGEGGMGTVYRATQESLGREVAVKILPERLTRNPRFVQRFYREARSAAMLVHPNIIQIYSLGQDENAEVHYYAMEYVRGKDLSQILRGGTTFKPDQAITILIQVAEALRAAHEGGVIHRDIKPANIMMTKRGTVKVMDFGLAKMANDEAEVTLAGTIVGTANYMSPEQAQGKDMDIRTDIYSLGVVFFELLTGRPPFKADDPSAVIYQHIYEKAPKPSKFVPEIPPAVDNLVLRMMAKEPEDRVLSPADLVDALKRLKDRLTVSEEPAAKPKPSAPPPDPVTAAEQAERAEEEAVLSPTQRLSVDQRARAGTVLVCDGSEYIRRMYRAGLEADYAVATVGSGKECLDMVVEGRPEVLVLDLAIKKPDGWTVLEMLRQQRVESSILVVTGDRKSSTVEKLARYRLAGVMLKPVKLSDLRLKVAALLGKASASVPGTPVIKARRRSTSRQKTSQSFVDEVARQEAGSAARLNIARLATKLIGRQNEREALIIARRIKVGSPNQIIEIIRKMFADIPERDAWQLAIYAFKEGDHRVRILTAELAGRRFDPKKAAELLTRFAADTDYRVRISALRELAACGAPGAVKFLARFLNDESWKVRREAARGLESLADGHVLEPLVLYYARNDIPPPLYLQRLVKGSNPKEAVEKLEGAALRAKSVRTKEFVADLLGQASSKTVVPALLTLLEDRHPTVRTAAARALAGFPTDLVKRALFKHLTDDRFGVLKAVAETLGVFHLQRATQTLIKLFTTTGKRVPTPAARFIARCDESPNAFVNALVKIDAEEEPVRQVLAFVLKRLYETDAAVTAVVRRLRSSKQEESAAAARETADRLAKFLIA